MRSDHKALRVRITDLMYHSIILNVVAPIVNGFVSWAVSYYTGTFAPWKIIFLTLGAFTIFWSAIVFFFL